MLAVGLKPALSHEGSHGSCHCEAYSLVKKDIKQIITQIIIIVKIAINKKYRVLWRMYNVGLNQSGREDDQGRFFEEMVFKFRPTV